LLAGLVSGLSTSPAAAQRENPQHVVVVSIADHEPTRVGPPALRPVSHALDPIPSSTVREECGCCYEEEIEGGVFEHVQYEGTICTSEGELRDYDPEGVHPYNFFFGRCQTNHFSCNNELLVATVLDLANSGDVAGIAALAVLNPDLLKLNRARNAVQIPSCSGDGFIASIPIGRSRETLRRSVTSSARLR
jgi:hypothetical protein